MSAITEPYALLCHSCYGLDEHTSTCEHADFICPNCGAVGEPLDCAFCDGIDCGHCAYRQHAEGCRVAS